MAKKLVIGSNDLESQNTSILRQWDYEKNGSLTPKDVSYSSNRKVWWKCDNGHSWNATVQSRFYSTGECPVCSNQRVVKGVNDFESQYHELMSTWDYSKNTVSPSSLSVGSGQSVWWKCEKGHSWKTSITQRKKQDGCPYCRGRKIWSGYNDFATLFPDLLKEWDFTENAVNPYEIAPATTKKYHWICPKGHKYEAAISSRTRLGTGCPYCASQKALPGFNDFETLHPDLVKEWDYSKNGDLKPSDFCEFSEKSVWWICNKGHSWKTMIESRSRGYGCPICAKEYKTSIPEQALYFYIKKYFPDAINNYKTDWLGKSELDIFIPDRRIAIEFDGRVWHKNTEKDILKNELCRSHDIRVIRVREPGIPLFDEDCIGLERISFEGLSNAIARLFAKLGIESPIIDVEKDLNDIYGLMQYREKSQSITKQYPNIASEWDYEKNSPYLSPDVVNCNSKVKVFWICPKGHHYEARVEHRTRSSSGCPYCAGKKVMIGDNDLKSQYPKLAAEWSNQNLPLTPEQVTAGSNKKVWWRCQYGHEWEAVISARVKGSNCPFCAGQKAIPGKTDIATVAPDLIEEWDYEKNIGLLPNTLPPMSRKIVWWKCKEGHSWQNSIRNRYLQKTRLCPICNKQK